MKKNYTHISVILDRTGSMESIRDDTIGGFNTFLKGQKAVTGAATLTLVQFDTQDPYEVIQDFVPLAQVPELRRDTYVPRASTPLLDAMGRGINDLEKRIGLIPASRRPSKVIFVVITDGQENSSREFRKDQITKMIKDRTKKNDWDFVFLSADLAAIHDAMSVGFHPDAVLLFKKDKAGSSSAWDSMSDQICARRAGHTKKVSFGDDDRKDPSDPNKQGNSQN